MLAGAKMFVAQGNEVTERDEYDQVMITKS